MILIVSDLFKSVWCLIFPAVVFFQGTVKDSSSFCQATGFLVALGIQASGRQSNKDRFFKRHPKLIIKPRFCHDHHCGARCSLRL